MFKLIKQKFTAIEIMLFFSMVVFTAMVIWGIRSAAEDRNTVNAEQIQLALKSDANGCLRTAIESKQAGEESLSDTLVRTIDLKRDYSIGCEALKQKVAIYREQREALKAKVAGR